MQELYEGIYSLFDTVNSLNTALSGRLYPHEGPQRATFPYATYHKIYGGNDYNFTDDFENIGIQFSLFSDSNDPEEVNTLYGYLKTLFDDAALSVTGYSVVKCQRVDDTLLRDAEQMTWAYHVDYDVMLRKDRGR